MKFPNHSFFLFLAISVLISLISGCATTHTTVGFEDDSSEFFSIEEIQTSIATKTDAEIAEVDEEDKEAEVVAVEKRETFNSSKGYWRAAIRYLQTGNEDDARWALENSLALNPKSKVANELMYQLDTDAINELGSENFDYKVQYGDSLSKLSKLYLNNALKFYLLAKYNDIPDPSRLVVGQVIQIPGSFNPTQIANTDEVVVETTIESKTVENNLEGNSSSDSQLYVDAKEMLNAGENLATIELLENSQTVVSADPSLSRILVKAYYLEAKDLLSKKEFVESKLLLSRAVELEPDNTEVNMMLIDMNEVDHAESTYKKALKAISENDPVSAYTLLNETLNIQPGHHLAIEKKVEVKEQLIQHYYKQALMAQRKHELDNAIEYWDEVLALDENNDNAKLYRAKAVNLKIKLERFVSSQ